MTDNQKGYMLQKKTEKQLQSEGFIVHTVARPSCHKTPTGAFRRSQHDLFGLWDHIAVNQTTGAVLFIQTKSRKLYGKDLVPFQEFPAKNKFIYSWLKSDPFKKNSRYVLLITKV